VDEGVFDEHSVHPEVLGREHFKRIELQQGDGQFMERSIGSERRKADTMITTVQEPDGRWLAYCEQYRVASYGTNLGDALENNRNMVAEVSSDPEWRADSFVMPELGNNDLVGPELLKVLIRWTGISEDYFAEPDEDE
jgi:hypothetical protein